MVDPDSNSRHPFLASLGERVRMLRARRGMTRRAVAQAAQVSERHLANLEAGSGNASVLILLQVAQALNCSIVELLGDVTTSSPEWLLIRELLGGRNEAQLQRVLARKELEQLVVELGPQQGQQQQEQELLQEQMPHLQ